VTAQVRENDHERFVFFMNFTEESKHIEFGGDEFKDILTGVVVGQSLALGPYDVRIVRTSNK